MDKININPNRLKWCCDTLDINLESLSREINIAYQTIARAMDNEPVLSIKQLGTIAKYFNRGMLFFLEENNVQEEKVYSPQFRTINNQRPIHSHKLRALIERIERQRQVYLGLLEDMGEEIQLDWYPHYLSLNPESFLSSASTAREWLGLMENHEFEDLRKAVEDKGIMVIVTNGYNGKWQISKENPVRGLSLYYDTLPIIVIKKQRSKGAQAFTMMHELAHLLLHKESMIDEEADFYSYQGKEKEANEFAGNILVPTDFLSQLNAEDLLELDVAEYDNYLKQLRKRWCVSGEVILIRLLQNNLIHKIQYDRYRDFKKNEQIIMGSGGARYRHKEPAQMFGKTFVSVVLDSLRSKKITLAKASTYLDNIKIKDIHKLEGR